MGALLKVEFLKCRSNYLIIIVIVLSFVLGLFAMGGRYNNIPLEMTEEAGGTSSIVYDVQASAVDEKIPQDPKAYLKYANDFYGTSFETLEEFYHFLDTDMITDYMFPGIMTTSTASIISGFLLASFYLLWDFKKRAFEPLIAAGRSRTQIVVSRAIGYYTIIIVIEMLVTLLTLLFYARTWVSLYSFGQFIGYLGLKLLLLCGTMSVPFMVVFLLKKPVAAGFVNLVYCVGAFLINRSYESDISGFITPFPALAQANTALWRSSAQPEILIQSILWPVLFIVLSFLICNLSFKQYEIKLES